MMGLQRGMRKLRRLLISALPLVAAACACLGIASCGDVPGASRVVAKVNGKDITYGDLMQELQTRRGPVVLLDMVDDALVRQEAQKRGISLTEQERGVGLERAAARVGSMSDLEAKLQRSGIPMEAYRRGIETEMLLDRIVQQETKITDAEIVAYYKAHAKDFQKGVRARARMMLFRDKSSAEAILGALKTPGSDFAGLAKGLSQDETTAAKGGDMGYFEKKDYAPAISDAAFKLKPGELTGIIQVPDGYVILRGEGSKPAGPLALQEVSKDIRQRLQAEKQPQVREQWLIAARKAASLSITNKGLREGVKARMGVVKPMPMPGEL
jgi:foldase protein PrsA